MTRASRDRFAEVVRAERIDLGLACLLIGNETDPGHDVDVSLDQLATLAAAVPRDRPANEALRTVLGAWSGDATDFEDVRSSLLHEVLRRRRGLPLLLSVLWCEVARRCDIPATCLGKPGKVLALIDNVVVDPFEGGQVRPVQPAPVLDPNDVLLRLLTNVRALTVRQGPSLEAARTRLWATDLSLLLPRHPLDLRRERGELLIRTGAFLEGAAELETFAQIAPEEAAATALRSARLARAQLN